MRAVSNPNFKWLKNNQIKYVLWVVKALAEQAWFSVSEAQSARDRANTREKLCELCKGGTRNLNHSSAGAAVPLLYSLPFSEVWKRVLILINSFNLNVCCFIEVRGGRFADETLWFFIPAFCLGKLKCHGHQGLTDAPKGQQDTSHVSNENQIFLWWVWLKSFQDGKTEEKLWRKQRGRLVRRKQVFKMHREVSAVQVMEGSHYRSPQRPGCKNCWGKAKPLFQSLFLPPKIDYVQEIKGHKPRDIVVPPFHHLRYPLPNVNIYPEPIFCSMLFCH